MQKSLQAISELYESWKGIKPKLVEVLPQSGSERRYFRVHQSDGTTLIGTHGANSKENEAFIYFSKKFKSQNFPVATIHKVSSDGLFYLQEDFGDNSLLYFLEKEEATSNIYALFKKSLEELAKLQVNGDKELDYTRCLTNQEFGKQAIMADLLYFKYYFLDALRKPYDKQKLIADFELLSQFLSKTEYHFFMFRDFQSRNIMVQKDNSIHFIDYQGGMKGAPQYDVASLLWQAKAHLSNEWKENLLEDYMNALELQISKKLDRTSFRNQYKGFVLIRLLQVLGAYGFRGLFERKAHFLTSIPTALKNLNEFLSQNDLNIEIPEFQKVLAICTSDETIQQFSPRIATDQTPLVINITSFAYKNGIPTDNSGNGGGFVFDCRGILNPGRLEEFKILTGRDNTVKSFLEQQTKMITFLNSVFDTVDITVEEYLDRNFQNLAINFGCTGGQHRSVYAADALARHLKNKFNVKIILHHREQNIVEKKGIEK